MRERKIRGEGLERERKKPPRVTRPTLRNKNSLYAELLLRLRRFFCIPLDTRATVPFNRFNEYIVLQWSRWEYHASLLFSFFFVYNYLPLPTFFFRLLFVSLLLILLIAFTRQTKHLKCLL